MPNRSASDIAAELESRAKSYDIIGNCDDKEFPASVEYHLSAGGDAARHTARLMREAASLLRAGPAGKMNDPLRALVARLEERFRDEARDLFLDAASWREAADMTGGHAASSLMRDALANEKKAAELEKQADECQAALDALLSAPVWTPPPQEGLWDRVAHRYGIDQRDVDWMRLRSVSAPVGSPPEGWQPIAAKLVKEWGTGVIERPGDELPEDWFERMLALLREIAGSVHDIRPAIFDPEHYPEDR